MGKEEEPRPKQEQIPDIKTTVKQLISEIKSPAPPHIAVLFASGGWAGRLADLREALRSVLPASTVLLGGAAPGVLGATQSVVDEVEPRDGHGAVSLGLIRLDGGARLSSVRAALRRPPRAAPRGRG